MSHSLLHNTQMRFDTQLNDQRCVPVNIYNGYGSSDQLGTTTTGECLSDESSALAYDVRIVQHMCQLSCSVSSASSLQPGVAWTERLRRQAEALLRDDWACDSGDNTLRHPVVDRQLSSVAGFQVPVNRSLLGSQSDSSLAVTRMHQSFIDHDDISDVSSDEDKFVHELVRERVDVTLKLLTEVKDTQCHDGDIDWHNNVRLMNTGQCSGDLRGRTDDRNIFDDDNYIAHSPFRDAADGTVPTSNLTLPSDVLQCPVNDELNDGVISSRPHTASCGASSSEINGHVVSPSSHLQATNLQRYNSAANDCDSQTREDEELLASELDDSCSDEFETGDEAANAVATPAIHTTFRYEVMSGFLSALPLNVLLLLLLLLAHSNIFISAHFNYHMFGQRPL